MSAKELTKRQIAFHNTPADPRHGTQNGYTNLRCRCSKCRASNAAYCNELKLRRSSRTVPDRLHGTVNAYTNYLCRCPDCRMAYRDSRRTPETRPNQTRESIAQMYKDYLAGLTTQEVAAKYGVHRTTVYYGFNSANLPLLRHHTKPTSSLYFDYCQGMSIEDVAQKWGISASTVRHRFKTAGLPLRPNPKKVRQSRPYQGVRNTTALVAENIARTSHAVQEHSSAWEAALPVSDERQSQVIRLRLQNPDWPLSRIGEEMNPPASKDTVAALLRRARLRGNQLLKVAS